MTAYGVIEVQFLRGIECPNPIIRIAVAHEWRPAMQHVARYQHFFFGKENPDIAVSVRAPEPQDLNRSWTSMKNQAAVESHRRQSHLHTLELAEVGFGFAQDLGDGLISDRTSAVADT